LVAVSDLKSAGCIIRGGSTPPAPTIINNLTFKLTELKKLGKHCVAELYGCDHTILDNEKVLSELLKEAINVAGATLLNMSSHKFTPQGVTIVALLSESHISIHTWPEDGSAALDVFTCGNSSPDVALLHCINFLKPTEYNMNCFDR